MSVTTPCAEWRVTVRAQDAPAAAATEEVDLALRQAACAWRVVHRDDDPGDDGGLALHAVYLVEAEQAPPFLEQVAELVVAHPELAISCAGPTVPVR